METSQCWIYNDFKKKIEKFQAKTKDWKQIFFFLGMHEYKSSLIQDKYTHYKARIGYYRGQGSSHRIFPWARCTMAYFRIQTIERARFKVDHLQLAPIILRTKKQKFINRNQTIGKYYQIFLLQKRVSWVMEYRQLKAQDQIGIDYTV